MLSAAAPLAVTGAGGRLGRALMAAANGPVVGWSRPELDLDDPASIRSLLDRDRPNLVVHSAAMTAVDEAASSPEVAMRRNGTATEALAQDCRARDLGLVVVSTNEVFDGQRTDGHGYQEDDPTAPRNPYGNSKLAGERAALDAFGGAPGLWIVRTSWLYGPPGQDFPDKITAAADRVAPEPLPVVSDEIAGPTYSVDLARAILALVTRSDGGTYHLVNGGSASRLEWARAVLAVRRPGRVTRAISRAEFERRSDPPPWGVLDGSRARALGIDMRPWREALESYLVG